jgi:hypothetical protein
MALSNNLGSIHAKLGRDKESCHCFEQLLSTIMLVTQSPGCLCEENVSLYKEESLYMEGFSSPCAFNWYQNIQVLLFSNSVSTVTVAGFAN